MAGVKGVISRWLLPPGIQDLLVKILKGNSTDQYDQYFRDNLRTIHSNEKFKDIHLGQRCFILCNGESVATQDLTPLKDEIVFSVSQGYLLDQYEDIKPQYHCSPQLTYTDLFTEKVAIEYLKEMESLTGNAEIFLSTNEKKLVNNNNIFSRRQVNYLSFYCGEQSFEQKKSFDISKPVPGVQSVPIMCIMIAMYMGFSRIYLLGTDHDVIVKNKYNYPFKQKSVLDKVNLVNSSGDIMYDYMTMFESYVALWRQYHSINSISKKNEIEIFNSTNGGILDVFKRVDLNDLF